MLPERFELPTLSLLVCLLFAFGFSALYNQEVHFKRDPARNCLLTSKSSINLLLPHPALVRESFGPFTENKDKRNTK